MRRQGVVIIGFLAAVAAIPPVQAQQPAAAQTPPAVNIRVYDLDAVMKGQELPIAKADIIVREGAIANWRPLAFATGINAKEEPVKLVSIAVSAGDDYAQRFVTILRPTNDAPVKIYLAKRGRKTDTIEYARDGQKLFGEEYRKRFGVDAAISWFYAGHASLDPNDATVLPILMRFGYARALKDGCIYGDFATCDEAYLIFSTMLDDAEKTERKPLYEGIAGVLPTRHLRDGIAQMLQYQYTVEMRHYQQNGDLAQAEAGLRLISDSKLAQPGTRAAARYHMAVAQSKQCPANGEKCAAALQTIQEMRGGAFDLQSVGISRESLDALAGDVRRRQKPAEQPRPQ